MLAGWWAAGIKSWRRTSDWGAGAPDAGRRRHSWRVRRAGKMVRRRRFEIMIGVILSDLKTRVFHGL